MKKAFLTLAAAATVFAAVPAAQAHETTVSSIDNQDDYSVKALLLDEIGVIPSKGEVEFTFDYNPSLGNEIRYYLRDDDKAGMTLKIYNDENRQVATAKTSKTNNYYVNQSFRPPSKYIGKYRVIIVPNDGGSGYRYQLSARAF
ncbi:hypothetical protein M5X00_21720 [Paenibacillus alvei]|uniref:Copper resistance protein CopC n=1 Tax=Paenibacillus alvei TaxID=44250 RepID=A0ABT4GTI8_PAEAL|nr:MULTISPECIES: hypothetical protein [Paenibacillus]EJW17861.1 hypothetical protein PAV_3c03100 [Paenibacillus alvei DSM 29]MBG9733823.1 hypothetical protein [Paenibacillus alvei]MBG9743858.1 hypothetical protein [Paenibacillus alvei]MCY7483280.1 hypothetical protein [Paenibacillus alvei]MCY9544548.1 hypothetical protein [Paenibacillus alvei]